MTTSASRDAIEHEIGPSGEFSLKLPAGEVELHGGESGTVVVRDLDGHPLEDRFDVERELGQLRIRMRDGAMVGLGFLRGGPGRGRARLRVELPRQTTVEVDTASASIDAKHLVREQRYRSASGEIRITGSGTLTIDSVSGNVRLDADGDVELATRVVSGDVTVAGGRLRSAIVTTTSGDVELDSDLTGPGPYGIQTVSGDALVRAGAELKIEARTLTGDIEGTLETLVTGRLSKKRRNDRVIGGGRHVLTFKSISGDLRVADPRAGIGRNRLPGCARAAGPAGPTGPALGLRRPRRACIGGARRRGRAAGDPARPGRWPHRRGRGRRSPRRPRRRRRCLTRSTRFSSSSPRAG